MQREIDAIDPITAEVTRQIELVPDLDTSKLWDQVTARLGDRISRHVFGTESSPFPINFGPNNQVLFTPNGILFDPGYITGNQIQAHILSLRPCDLEQQINQPTTPLKYLHYLPTDNPNLFASARPNSEFSFNFPDINIQVVSRVSV